MATIFLILLTRDNAVKHFIFFDHFKFITGALLKSVYAVFKIGDFRHNQVIAGSEFGIGLI